MDDFVINIIFLLYYLEQWISCCSTSVQKQIAEHAKMW